MGFFRKIFSGEKREEHQPVPPDLSKILQEIENKDESGDIPLGRKIYSFDYDGLEIRFDRDITHQGRICIFQGEERLFSFTVFAKEGEYDILRDAFKMVTAFLNGSQSIKNLPDNQVLKGFYHRH